jgi:hypothetical protein
MENHNDRRQKLSKFLGQYQSGQMYKHGLKISAHTNGGNSQKQFRSQMEIFAQCDSKVRSCKGSLNIDAKKLDNEKWTLNAQAQMLRPTPVSSVNELEENTDSRQKKFIAQAQCEWGSNNQQKQHLTIRIQGEKAQTAEWRRIEKRVESQGNGKQYKRETSFLNKFDVSVDYRLQPQAQQVFRAMYEALKARNYWNTQVRPQFQQGQQQQQGQINARIVIDPITQRHCNVSVQTPTEQARIEQMELPIKSRPFPLIRQSSSGSQSKTHSALQFFDRWSQQKRSECTVDGRRVNTFDDTEYRTPIGGCYSVLAKDCSGRDEEGPRFVVMMKAMNNNNGQKKNSNSQPKKVKVITPEQTVECQPKSDSSSRKLVCKVNGQKVTGDNNNNQNNDYEQDEAVQCNNAQCSDVTINVPSRAVSVRFDGRKAQIKISSQYKKTQCGLCGDYNGDSQNEWRMADNELTSDLGRFHRSYSLLQQEEDGECTADAQQEFYTGHKAFKKNNNKKNYNDDSSSSSEESNEWDNTENNSQEDEDSFNNNDSSEWFSSSNRNNNKRRKNGNNGSFNSPRNYRWAPQLRTEVKEIGNKVCFSMEPVKQCPPQAYNNGESKMKRVTFACLSRSSPSVKNMLREARLGEILNMGGHKPSLTEPVFEHSKCEAY